METERFALVSRHGRWDARDSDRPDDTASFLGWTSACDMADFAQTTFCYFLPARGSPELRNFQNVT